MKSSDIYLKVQTTINCPKIVYVLFEDLNDINQVKNKH